MACRAIPKEPQRRPPRLCQVSGPRSPGSPRVSQDAGGNSIFATLRMPSVICNVALFLSDDELKAMAWTTFVSGITEDRYPELVQYLKERRLYVNEPVESEVEA